MTDSLSSILTDSCKQLGLKLSEVQIAQLLDYVRLLDKWNKTYNLTAIRGEEAIMTRHVVDALSVVSVVAKYSPATLADIGTGGGIPGVILAIVFPDLHVYLVESIGKKCRFLRYATANLGLSGRVQVIQQRVERWQLPMPLSIIICRAFTSLANFTAITRHLGDEHTLWLAMKADDTDEEMTQLPNDFILSEDEVLCVPFEEAERHLLTLKKVK